MSFPIKGFIETSFVDWPGKIASIIFLPLCNFRCPYCHNYDLVLDPDQFPSFPMDYIIGQLRHLRNWIDGVCITGGEPTLLPNLTELIKTLRNEHMLVKLDTNGSQPEIVEQLIRDRLVDCISMDVKAPFDTELYSRCAGVQVNLDNIKASVDLLRSNCIPYQFRTTVVPTLHTEENLMQLAHELEGCSGLKLQNFSPVHTLDPEYLKIVPYSEDELASMQDEVNLSLSGTRPSEGYNCAMPYCA
jgi:pyruvate formate lyase activating enzyme